MSKVQKNEFNISGKVKLVISPTQFKGPKYKRLILIVWNGNRSSEVEFCYYNDNMALLDDIKEGTWVNLDFKLSGYKKNYEEGITRWYTNLIGISCNKQ